MRILVLHNSYRQAGGEDAAVSAEVRLLREHGHEVKLEVVANDDIGGLISKVAVFWHSAHDTHRARWVRDLVRAFRPQIVHVHNFFPLLSPSVHEAAGKEGVAVVQTLHNYRTICAGALLLRDGQICEKCIDGTNLWGVVHRCYRGSLPGSAAVVRLQSRAKRHRTWDRSVHRFIALSEFARSKFISAGFRGDTLAVKPNFSVRSRPPVYDPHSRPCALYVGRLSLEKGVDVLLRAWRALPDFPLTIVGDGPERSVLEGLAPPNVTFLGAQSGDRVRQELATAACLVVPSIWYEGFPMVVAEALSEGVPIVASRLGALPEIVEEGLNGRLFAAGDPEDLAQTLLALLNRPEELRALSRGAEISYRTRYSPEVNIRILESIYADAMAELVKRQQS